MMVSLSPDQNMKMDEVLAYSRPIFNGADEDRDGQLGLEEYAAFMHPELHIRMVDVLVNSFLEQYDNNDDGYVSFFEFLGERYPTCVSAHCVYVCVCVCVCVAVYMPKSAEERGREPDWADKSRAMFRETLDEDENGL